MLEGQTRDLEKHARTDQDAEGAGEVSAQLRIPASVVAMIPMDVASMVPWTDMEGRLEKDTGEIPEKCHGMDEEADPAVSTTHLTGETPRGEGEMQPQIMRSKEGIVNMQSLMEVAAEMAKLRSMINSIPTKQDMVLLLNRVETSIRSDLEKAQKQINAIETRTLMLEKAVKAQEEKSQAMEMQLTLYTKAFTSLQLHVDDIENRSRRKNIRIKGIPETVNDSNLKPMVTILLNQILENPPDTEIDFDRLHRVGSSSNTSKNFLRDVLCRIHYYRIKEDILKKAWKMGTIIFNDLELKKFPDISKHTLQQRKLLKPLLECIQKTGGSYRWGYPFQLLVRKNDLTFQLQYHAQLPALFKFLQTEEIEIPNWLALETPLWTNAPTSNHRI